MCSSDLPGDLCELGSQLRPHIVLFGEPVPNMEEAIALAKTADIFVIAGTSLTVYPAAGLVRFIRPGTPVFVIDPGNPEINAGGVTFIRKTASEGVAILTALLSDFPENENIKPSDFDERKQKLSDE